MSQGTQIYTVHNQWVGRKDDERVLNLAEMEAKCAHRKDNSAAIISDNKTLKLHAIDLKDRPDIQNGMLISTADDPKWLTNWSFGQLCSAVKAPASYLRTLPSEKAVDLLNYGLEVSDRERNQIYVNRETDELLSFNSETYGRIYDLQVVQGVRRVNAACNDRWKIPAATYDKADPRRATTLYCSDRDIFIFLVDPDNPIEVNGEVLYRGFYTWNSEVGAKTFGLATFLYRRVCDNRIIWGAEQFTEFKIKHTSGAPERFLQEGKKMLSEYAESSAKQIEERIATAQKVRLGKDEDEVKAFLTKKFDMTQGMASSVIEMAKSEEGGHFHSAWDIAQGITAKARSIAHTDSRVEMEKLAGKLLDKVTK